MARSKRRMRGSPALNGMSSEPRSKSAGCLSCRSRRPRCPTGNRSLSATQYKNTIRAVSRPSAHEAAHLTRRRVRREVADSNIARSSSGSDRTACAFATASARPSAPPAFVKIKPPGGGGSYTPEGLLRARTGWSGRPKYRRHPKYNTEVSRGFRQAGNNVALSRAILSVGTTPPGRPAACSS